ncbi:hypothetical protein F5878DRAFT_728240 [Lentinula raphanica]|uniref:Cyclin N-terminal domain-containing protein n=1 Tax=Lentinula raphanica TaxID=153919 RepID=A0AA38U8J9_9AGAR|nr:hypothetical protein F5878DRAFT_728240 [Lentinula raphanica]
MACLMMDPSYYNSLQTATRTQRSRADKPTRVVHPASLVDPKSHSSALLLLINARVTSHVAQYAADNVADCLGFYLNIRPRLSEEEISYRQAVRLRFRSFVQNLFDRSGVTIPVIITSIIYIERAQVYLSYSKIDERELARIYLASIIVASKYLNDCIMSNTMWEEFNAVFGAQEIAEFELSFLACLRWKMKVSDRDILLHYDDTFFEDPAIVNNPHYFCRSDPSQPRTQFCLSPSGYDCCPGLASPSSFSSGDASLPHTPTDVKKSSRKSPSKHKSAFRKFLHSFRVHS